MTCQQSDRTSDWLWDVSLFRALRKQREGETETQRERARERERVKFRFDAAQQFSQNVCTLVEGTLWGGRGHAPKAIHGNREIL